MALRKIQFSKARTVRKNKMLMCTHYRLNVCITPFLQTLITLGKQNMIYFSRTKQKQKKSVWRLNFV